MGENQITFDDGVDIYERIEAGTDPEIVADAYNATPERIQTVHESFAPLMDDDTADKSKYGRAYTKDELRYFMKGEALANFNGDTPPSTYWDKHEHLPTRKTFIRRFGRYNNAVEAAGLEPNSPG